MGWAWEGDGVDQLQTIYGTPGQVSPDGSHANSLRSPWVKTQGCLRSHGKPGFRLRTPRSAVPRSRPHNGSIFSCQRSLRPLTAASGRSPWGDARAVRTRSTTRMACGAGRVNTVMSKYYQVDSQWQPK